MIADRSVGGSALLALGAAYYFYAQWVNSLWCLFAKLLGAVIYLHFALQGRESFMSRPAETRPAAPPSS